MSRINVHCDLAYEVCSSAVFLFQVVPAQNSHQQVVSESFQLNPLVNVERYLIGIEQNNLQRVVIEPCEFQISYHAVVELTPQVQNTTAISESLVSQMPPEVLTFLNPSRYCESDLMTKFAFEQFGQLDPGFSRVQAICDWVTNHMTYTPESTNSSTTANDVLKQGTGVCRDYAHLMISLCRAMGIPARYISGYALNLQPQDFHGFTEVFLGGQWYLFDPTKLSKAEGLIRIGTGRDAADVSVATITGDVNLTLSNVNVFAADQTAEQIGNQPAAAAVSNT